jgi:hypothetical protein
MIRGAGSGATFGASGEFNAIFLGLGSSEGAYDTDVPRAEKARRRYADA